MIVDHGGVDAAVAQELLDHFRVVLSDQPGGEGVTQHVGVDVPVEGFASSLSYDALEVAGRDAPASLLGEEEGSVQCGALAAGAFPGEKFAEVVHDGAVKRDGARVSAFGSPGRQLQLARDVLEGGDVFHVQGQELGISQARVESKLDQHKVPGISGAEMVEQLAGFLGSEGLDGRLGCGHSGEGALFVSAHGLLLLRIAGGEGCTNRIRRLELAWGGLEKATYAGGKCTELRHKGQEICRFL